MKKLNTLLLCTALSAGIATAATPGDTIYYRTGHRYVDASFRDNAATLGRLKSRVDSARVTGTLRGLSVRSQASPEGRNAANERLAANRAAEMKRWIVGARLIGADSITTISNGIAWQQLRDMVAASDIPSRQEILDIIDNTPVFVFDSRGRIVDGRLRRLRRIAGGTPYRIMLDRFFPQLRNSVTVSLLAGTPLAAASGVSRHRLSYAIGQTAPDMTRSENRDKYSSATAALARPGSTATVTHFSAPDGINDINRNVGANRAARLAEGLAADAGVSPAAVTVVNGGEGWHELLEIVRADPRIPDREEIEAIINGDPTQRVKRLKKLSDGATWAYLREHTFPAMRSSLLVSVGTPAALAADAAARTAVDAGTPEPAERPAALRGNHLTYAIGQTEPDMTLAANRRAIDAAADSLTAGKRLRLIHYSAPDGINDVNAAVGATRTARLAAILAEKTGAGPASIDAADAAEGWSLLRAIAAADTAMPGAAEVIAIVNGFPGQRVEKLRKLNGGATWAYLRKHTFPAMRATITVAAEEPAAPGATSGESAEDGQTDAAATAPASPFSSLSKLSGRWAFKTNLLYDAILAPSVEVEYMFAPRWSAGLEYTMPWWKSKNKIYQIAAITPEARWWFHSRSPFRGHYVGVFPGFTWYDLESGGTGHRGHGFFAGISYGFAFGISPTLGFEAGIGVGYMALRYKDYEPADGHHLYMRSKTAGYFGPLRAKFALVWRPWANTNKGKSNKKTQSDR